MTFEEIYELLGKSSCKSGNEESEYNMITQKLADYIRSRLPESDIDEDPFEAAIQYGDYVVECYENGDHGEAECCLMLAERLLSHDNYMISALGATAYLEYLADMLGDAVGDKEKFRSLLGKNSKRYLYELGGWAAWTMEKWGRDDL